VIDVLSDPQHRVSPLSQLLASEKGVLILHELLSFEEKQRHEIRQKVSLIVGENVGMVLVIDSRRLKSQELLKIGA
jgi:hypothetical protein